MLAADSLAFLGGRGLSLGSTFTTPGKPLKLTDTDTRGERPQMGYVDSEQSTNSVIKRRTVTTLVDSRNGDMEQSSYQEMGNPEPSLCRERKVQRLDGGRSIWEQSMNSVLYPDRLKVKSTPEGNFRCVSEV